MDHSEFLRKKLILIATKISFVTQSCAGMELAQRPEEIKFFLSFPL